MPVRGITRGFNTLQVVQIACGTAARPLNVPKGQY